MAYCSCVVVVVGVKLFTGQVRFTIGIQSFSANRLLSDDTKNARIIWSSSVILLRRLVKANRQRVEQVVP